MAELRLTLPYVTPLSKRYAAFIHFIGQCCIWFDVLDDIQENL